MPQANGNNVTVFVDPVNGSDGPGSTTGSESAPCRTFGRALDLLFGTQLSRGARVMKLAPGVYEDVTGSFNTASLYQWGGLGPLGINALPVVIEGSFTNELGNLTIVSQTGAAVVLDIPTPVALNQYAGFYLAGADGSAQYTIVSNTSNGSGGNVTFTLNAIPGDVFPVFVGDVQVQQPACEIQIAVDGEFAFFGAVLGIKGVRFSQLGNGPSDGSTLRFQDCAVYAQGVQFRLEQSSQLLIQDSLITSDPEQIWEQWDASVGQFGGVNPFSQFLLAGINVLSADGTGEVNLIDGSDIQGPWYANTTFLTLDRSEARISAAYLFLSLWSLIHDSHIEFVPIGLARGTVVASAANFDDSEFSFTQTDYGGVTLDLFYSRGTAIDVKNVAGWAITGPVYSIIRDSFVRAYSGDYSTAIIGSTGVAQVAQHLVTTYAALTGNANPPADAGGYTANDPSGHSTNCRMELMTSALG